MLWKISSVSSKETLSSLSGPPFTPKIEKLKSLILYWDWQQNRTWKQWNFAYLPLGIALCLVSGNWEYQWRPWPPAKVSNLRRYVNPQLGCLHRPKKPGFTIGSVYELGPWVIQWTLFSGLLFFKKIINKQNFLIRFFLLLGFNKKTEIKFFSCSFKWINGKQKKNFNFKIILVTIFDSLNRYLST